MMTYAKFEEKCKECGISKKDFAQCVGMNYVSVTNWKQTESVPAWVEPFLTYYEKAQDLEKIFKILEKHRRV